MGELRKQFKEQTGNNCATTIKGEPVPTWSYVTWLESRTPANEAVELLKSKISDIVYRRATNQEADNWVWKMIGELRDISTPTEKRKDYGGIPCSANNWGQQPKEQG